MAITHDEIKARFDYNPDTGILTHKTTIGGVKVGSIAGTKNNAGHLYIGLNYKTVAVHRVAWFWMTGVWPENVDHKNRVRADNIWTNLREATHSKNMRNCKVQKNCKSKVTGVSWSGSAKQWRANIYTDEGRTHLGWFKDKFEAICARKSAENKHGYIGG